MYEWKEVFAKSGPRWELTYGEHKYPVAYVVKVVTSDCHAKLMKFRGFCILLGTETKLFDTLEDAKTGMLTQVVTRLLEGKPQR